MGTRRIHVAGYAAHRLRIRGVIGVLQHRQITEHDGQGRAQFVADHVEKRRLLPVGLLGRLLFPNQGAFMLLLQRQIRQDANKNGVAVETSFADADVDGK